MTDREKMKDRLRSGEDELRDEPASRGLVHYADSLAEALARIEELEQKLYVAKDDVRIAEQGNDLLKQRAEKAEENLKDVVIERDREHRRVEELEQSLGQMERYKDSIIELANDETERAEKAEAALAKCSGDPYCENMTDDDRRALGLRGPR